MPKQFYDRTLFSPHLYSNNTVVRTAYILSHNLTLNEMLNCCVFSHQIESYAEVILPMFGMAFILNIITIRTTTKNTICRNSIEYAGL